MEVQAVINLYRTRGFNVTRVEGDREFACLEHDLLPIPLNIADADDHVAEVERSIRTIKERTRCLIQGLPFRRIPKAMMRAAIESANKSLNQFPANNGASDTMSPLTIMTGCPNPDYNDMKIEFGAYAQVFEANEPTNTVKARTTGAIALTPTGNAQGGFYFLSLATGRKLSRQQWDPLPMPDGVIATVEHMAHDEEQPLVGHGAPLFEWTPGVPIEEDAPAPVITHEPQHIAPHVEPAHDAPVFGANPVEDAPEPEEESIHAEIDPEPIEDGIEHVDSDSISLDADEDDSEPEDHRSAQEHDDEQDPQQVIVDDVLEHEEDDDPAPETAPRTTYGPNARETTAIVWGT